MPSSQNIIKATWESKCESCLYKHVLPSHFVRQENEARRGDMTFPRQLLAELGWNSSS